MSAPVQGLVGRGERKRDPDAPVTVETAGLELVKLSELLRELGSGPRTLKKTLLTASMQNHFMMAAHWAEQLTLEEAELDACNADQDDAVEQMEAVSKARLPESVTFETAEKLIAERKAAGKWNEDSELDLALCREIIDRAGARFPAPKEESAEERLAKDLAAVKLDAATSAALASATLTPVVCAHCMTNPGVAFCGRCRARKYCSTECQKADWKTHKVECKAPHS